MKAGELELASDVPELACCFGRFVELANALDVFEMRVLAFDQTGLVVGRVEPGNDRFEDRWLSLLEEGILDLETSVAVAFDVLHDLRVILDDSSIDNEELFFLANVDVDLERAV